MYRKHNYNYNKSDSKSKKTLTLSLFVPNRGFKSKYLVICLCRGVTVQVRTCETK